GAVGAGVAMEADAGAQPLERAAAEQWRAARMEALAGADQRHRAGDAPQLGRGGCGGIGEEDVLPDGVSRCLGYHERTVRVDVVGVEGAEVGVARARRVAAVRRVDIASREGPAEA